MKYIPLLLFLALFGCLESHQSLLKNEQVLDSVQHIEKVTEEENVSDELEPDPDMLEQVLGDLDGDGINEEVIVWNTSEVTDFGNVREIQIGKLNDGAFEAWISSNQAILKSGEGGMMGDPFVGVKIENGILLIEHFGGSRWRWSYTDKYRYQNGEMVLIGHTSKSGAHCEYWENFDFNLSTGQINYWKEKLPCDDASEVETGEVVEKETFFEKGVKRTLQNRKANEFKITSPKLEATLYL